MNILPLIYGFIILFAIGTYAFVYSLRATIQEKFHYSGAIGVERSFANSVQNEMYKLQKGENLDSSVRTENKKKENAQFLSPRDKFNSKIYQKLNIKSLLIGQGNPALESVALSLIKNMYQATTVYTPGLEHEILDTLIRNLKEHSTITSFETLLPNLSSENYPLFYKLIKGTQSYELKTNAGYPALGDFLTFEPKTHTKPIHFGSASRSVLEALFGQELTEQIISQERRKWEIDHKHASITKKELEAFLVQHSKNLVDFEPMIEFTSKNAKRSQEVVQDKSTSLQIRINP